MEPCPVFSLRNGVEIPAVGFGTGIAKGLLKHPRAAFSRLIKEPIRYLLSAEYRANYYKYPLLKDMKKDMTLKRVSRKAYNEGYRLFDTARAYAYSEQYLGEALFSGPNPVERNRVFLISKVTNSAQRAHTVREDFELTLKNLRTDYLDLLLMHWPQPGEYLNTWKLMEELYLSGRVRAIGVCNCHIHHLEEIERVASVQPMANEIECHPLFQQRRDREYCKERGIQLIAYMPVGRMNRELLKNPFLNRLRDKYRLESITQVILRWHYQLHDISIPNTTNVKHMKSNFNIWNFSLTEEEMEDALSRRGA